MSGLLERIRRAQPAWHRHAACAGEPIEVFFPTRGGSTSLAYELCGRCPVRAECLAEALADPELDYGIRGGYSADARKAKRRAEARREGTAA